MLRAFFSIRHLSPSLFVQNDDDHVLEELLGFPLIKDGTRLGWLMNLNSVGLCTFQLFPYTEPGHQPLCLIFASALLPSF